MAPKHRKADGQPKWGQFTPKATNCMASALIGTKHYRFSGHPSNGTVYAEEATDTGVTMQVRTGRITNNKTTIAVQKATLMHADSGAGEAATLRTNEYHDAAGITF